METTNVHCAPSLLLAELLAEARHQAEACSSMPIIACIAPRRAAWGAANGTAMKAGW
jgi:hypothetical protein